VSTRVAVVVPCFNDGATLPQTLASLEGQEAHELVVVDDGSDDPATLHVLAGLEQAGVRVARRPNGGLSAARMTGVQATTAPYVLPLDADDLLAPGAVAALADALDAHPEAKLAWGDVRIFGTIELLVRLPERLDPWHLTYLNDVPGTCLIRRDALLDAGGWVLLSGYEDWDLWLTFVERGWNGVRAPRVTLHYRRSRGRMNEDSLGRHAQLYETVRSRHPALFAARRANWRRSTAPPAARILLPLVAAAPFLSDRDRHRLYLLFSYPRRALRGRTPRKLRA
jgi:glycosyltransferase involved in cell wall biosynthesis